MQMGESSLSILVLGHKGMLGQTVYRRLTEFGYSVETIEDKWPSKFFFDKITDSNSELLINCIGAIPQKNPKGFSSNFDLPRDLCKNYKGWIIHPSSDCEKDKFPNDYCISKKIGTDIIENHKKSFVIKGSIIGPEENSSYGLWSWFEKNKEREINGFVNHKWNGVTSLEWSNICIEIMNGFIDNSVITVGVEPLSKFDLLGILNSKLSLGKKIIPVEDVVSIDRSMLVDCHRKGIKDQIDDLIKWRK
jgi:dTDP-4-dehydrorhamnose reductase